MMRSSITLACVAVAAVAGVTNAATFYQRAVVDLTPVTSGLNANDIGSNASAVAWDGSTAYLAGFNNGTTVRDTALVNVANVLTTPTFGTRYGVQASTAINGRGYVGADFKSGVGFGTTFDGGTTGVVSLYQANGTQVFSINSSARPPAGPSFDTQTARMSYLVQGTNSLRNLDVTNGTETGTPATNIGTVTGNGTQNRDLDFDNSGNLYIRNANDVVRANRATASTFNATPTALVDLTASNSIGTNIATVEGFAANSLFAIYNDKTSNATGQALTSVVKAVRADGSAEALSFLVGDGSSSIAFPTSTAFYDFSYDATSQTLALLDFTNRQLYIFGATATAAVPEPTTLAALAGMSLVTLRRRRR